MQRARGIAFMMAWLAACEGSDEPAGQLAPTYANVEQVLMRSCAFSSSCHGGTTGQARLNFQPLFEANIPLTQAFRNDDGSPRAACEYDAWAIVDPGNPEESWLMTKLTGAADDEGALVFVPDANWNPDRSDPQCPRTMDGEIDFGRPMPLSNAEPRPLPGPEIELFREWIRAGAPGPG